MGKLIHCPKCTNFLEHSGLLEHEREYSVAQILDVPQSNAHVLRYVAEELLNDPYGFVTLWGGPGRAKSFVLQAYVADVCRAGGRARYVQAQTVQESLFEDRDANTSNYQLWREVDVLAIDEFDALNFTNDWVRGQIEDIVDYRYRRAINGEAVTLFATQYNPSGEPVQNNKGTWIDQPSKLSEKIFSRMRSDAFARVWHEGLGEPPDDAVKRGDLHVIPPIIQARGRDLRAMIPRRHESKLGPFTRAETRENGADD
jgi:hypothetical protein